jgi:hypothetical protein
MNYHYPGLNNSGLQPGDNKTPKYNTAASTAMLVAMPCLQRIIGGIAIGYRRLKPEAIEKSNYCISFIINTRKTMPILFNESQTYLKSNYLLYKLINCFSLSFMVRRLCPAIGLNEAMSPASGG